MTKLSHLDSTGAARMVDISAKTPGLRIAAARGKVLMKPETLALIMEGDAPKGDVLAVARVAGIMAAKRAALLIPLCHTLPLSEVALRFAPGAGNDAIEIESLARTTARTGVEMEALTAVTVAGLTIYDMAKGMDKSMRLSDIRLIFKSGGRSGQFHAEGESPPVLSHE